MITLKIKSTNSLIPTVTTIEKYPCRIGRSIKNTIVLEDQSISSEHALINFDQKGYYIMDLGSTNGIFNDHNEKKEKIYLENELSFKIGDLNVEVVFGDEFLEKTRVIKLTDYFPTKKASSLNFKILVAQMALIVLIIISKYLLNPLDKSSFQEILLDFGTYTIIVSFLTTAIALFSKLLVKKFRFREFYFFFSKWLVLIYIFSNLFPYFYFSLYYKDSFWNGLNSAVSLIISFYFIYRLISLTFTRTKKKIIILQVVGFCVSILIFFGLISFLDDKDDFDFYGSVSYPLKNYRNISSNSKELLINLNETFKKINEQKAIQLKEIEKNR